MRTSMHRLLRSLPGRLAIFAAALTALFAVGLGAGRLLDPAPPGAAADDGGMAEHSAAPAMGGGHGMAADGQMPVRGLAVAEHGLRLEVLDPELPRGRTRELRFRIVDSAGEPVRDYDVLHTKRMHAIVARRDLTAFQHLHPRLAADGTWAVPLRLDAAGSYRVFADFSHGGKTTTLAADLAVDGRAQLRPLPAPTATALTAGGYEVRLVRGAAHAGEETELRFEVSRGGRPVEVEPYLGAAGHLVALREGDLAFLHVHPHDGSVAFAATFPTPGRYRLFLQVKIEGQVETAAFTAEVE